MLAVKFGLSPRDLVWCSEYQPEVFAAILSYADRVAREESKGRR